MGRGANVWVPVTDMCWGDRCGAGDDPSLHRWGLATHVEDPTPEQMAQRQKEFFASMADKK